MRADCREGPDIVYWKESATRSETHHIRHSRLTSKKRHSPVTETSQYGSGVTSTNEIDNPKVDHGKHKMLEMLHHNKRAVILFVDDGREVREKA
jgi:hypothetical protein